MAATQDTAATQDMAATQDTAATQDMAATQDTAATQCPVAAGSVIYVAVVGPGDSATQDEADIARRVGRLLADRGAIVVCGGLGGVMAAACDGASGAGGLTVGLLPGRDRAEGNQHLSVALPTGLGELRNGLVVATSDAVIAIGGSWGTLSEIALAMRTGKPTVVIGGWEIGVHGAAAGELPEVAGTAEQAVAHALRMAAARN